MNLNSFLALELDEATEELKKRNYKIKKVSYLNEPMGNPRVVQIKEFPSRELEILASYEKKLF